MKRKSLVLILAAVVLVLASVGGTLAYLAATTQTITNGFTVGDINVTLAETGTDEENQKNYTLIPGQDFAKDPKVTVERGSQACYLFIKVESTVGDGTGVLTYSIDSGWQLVPNETKVYYRTVDSATASAGHTYSILTGDKVTVANTVTDEQLAAINDTSLEFTAYAIQSANLGSSNTPAGAWQLLKTQESVS